MSKTNQSKKSTKKGSASLEPSISDGNLTIVRTDEPSNLQGDDQLDPQSDIHRELRDQIHRDLREYIQRDIRGESQHSVQEEIRRDVRGDDQVICSGNAYAKFFKR